MAKRRTTSTAIVRTVPVRAPAPIIRVQAPRAPSTHHKRKGHRRKSGAGSTALNQGQLQSHAVGGFLYGIVEKNFGAQIPTLPVVGRAGAIALGCYFFGKGKGGMVADLGKAAAVIAGYQFGTTGKVSGAPAVAGVAPQVAGLAAQV